MRTVRATHARPWTPIVPLGGSDARWGPAADALVLRESARWLSRTWSPRVSDTGAVRAAPPAPETAEALHRLLLDKGDPVAVATALVRRVLLNRWTSVSGGRQPLAATGFRVLGALCRVAGAHAESLIAFQHYAALTLAELGSPHPALAEAVRDLPDHWFAALRLRHAPSGATSGPPRRRRREAPQHPETE